MTPRLVLATANAAKRREMAELLDGLGFDVRGLADYPAIALPPEGEVSYAENALGKARAVARATGAVTVADDSGIEVDALGGGPGVASARHGGPGLTDPERVTLLLQEAAGAPRRTARFRCLLALVAPWGAEVVTEGVVEGVLTDAPRGAGGFGYDPVFYVPDLGRTFAEVPAADKHRLSHRARAIAAARPILLEWARRARECRPPA